MIVQANKYLDNELLYNMIYTLHIHSSNHCACNKLIVIQYSFCQLYGFVTFSFWLELGCNCFVDANKCSTTCYGYSCDEWVASTGDSCDTLETLLECDCDGCECDGELFKECSSSDECVPIQDAKKLNCKLDLSQQQNLYVFVTIYVFVLSSIHFVML